MDSEFIIIIIKMIYKGEFVNGKREGIGAIFYRNIKVV